MKPSKSLLRNAPPGKSRPRAPRPPTAGRVARDVAVTAITNVLGRGRTFDEAFTEAVERAGPLEARDRGLARLIVMTVLRRRGELAHAVGSFLERPLPEDTGRLWPILLAAAAQLLCLETPPHAAISLAVDQTRGDQKARRFDKLTNAILRRVAAQGRDILAGVDGITLNVPTWLLRRWSEAYGPDEARAIAAASLSEAPLDLSVITDQEAWAKSLGGTLLSTGTVRLAAGGRIEELPGFADGCWWVQDQAAALPAKLLGKVDGLDVADLCAAPGGKTLQLAAAGARVTAVDLSEQRLARVRENLARLNLPAEVIAADALSWVPPRPLDAILLDAPCTATGTIRRHPDIMHLKRETDIAALAAIQARLLAHAAKLVQAGGMVIYCTCSLEPEEGPLQVEAFLAENRDFERQPVLPGEAGIEAGLITPAGDLRTLPTHGMDGFFAARLVRRRAAI